MKKKKPSDKNTTARLWVGGKTYELPVREGTAGQKALDISDLRARSGYVTIDRGLGNTASCESGVTFIDGEKGILRYRGYPIEQLAAHSRFVEVAYLLVYGELPNKEQLYKFSNLLNASSLIHEDMTHFFTGFPRNAHPMSILSTMVSSLSAFYPVPDELTDDAEAQIIAKLISQVRTIAAFSYKKSIGEPLVYPSIRLRYVENFLRMLFSSPVKNYEQDPDVVRAIDLFLMLHADHEQNCSTTTVRLVGSSLANVYSVVSAGISALWGKRHGGANQEVITMLEHIRATGCDAAKFVERARTGKDRLMGFGHRIYKTFDPRATILKEHCHRLLSKPGHSDPCFEIALQLEEIALKDDYFLSRNLYPNVDFYSGLILKAAGIPYDMFTVLFSIGRVPGWLAHWREMCHGGDFRLVRPRQVYVGKQERNYVDTRERNSSQ
jgi:citrate synthase